MFKIGLDVGYGNCKIVSEDGKRICFPSLAKEGAALDVDNSLGAVRDYVVKINGETWYIGDMAAKENRFAIRAFDDAERYTNSAFQAMLATCLAVSSDKDSRVLVVTGLPLAAYQNAKDEFQEFLSSFEANIEIGGESREVKVKEAYVFPQAAGIFLNPLCGEVKSRLNRGDLATVIDIGYRTTDIAVFEYSSDGYGLLMESSFTIDEGMVSVFHELGNRIGADIKTFNVSLETAERVFKSGTLPISGKNVDYREFCNSIAGKTVSSIADQFKLKGPEKSRNNTIILAGGGSIALEKQLKKVFPEAICLQDAQFANAVGFLDVANRLDLQLV